MKYILMMNAQIVGVDGYRAWPKQDIEAHSAFLMKFKKELSESGEFVATQRLGLPHQAKVVRAGKNGVPITDGVFPEAKEFLLGYWLIDVESAERAYEIAARLSAGPGPGGATLSMPIEVRQVMGGPPDEFV